MVHDLASLMGVNPIEVIKQLMRIGQMLTLNDPVEFETASLIAQSFGFPVNPLTLEESSSGSLVISTDQEDPAQLEPRPPVVTILGHVDHGKTTLLDAIRNTDTVAGEVGGITQHIGAYQVEFHENRITFLDTPGHEAFTAMRARGAQITDVALLVVAADDGIMPQTVEAIDHVRAAGVPLIAVISKIDRPESDPERVKRQLAEHDLLIEEWGGDVVSVPVSAIKGEGISDLLENILVVAEVSDLKANPHQLARGVVVEARIDKSKGPLATVLIQTGTLRVGNIVVAGEARGRVKAMLDYNGERIEEAGPSLPVEILGLSSLPLAGDTIAVAPDEGSARQMVETSERQRRSQRGSGVNLEEIYSRLESGEVISLDLIVKTDVQGSIDAVRSVLESLNTENTRVNLIHTAAGSITESDVMLAAASKAIIIGFNSRPEPGARTLANQEMVDIRFYDVIYELYDDVERALKGLLAPVTRDVVEGIATVRAVFGIGRKMKVAGIYVNNGLISRGADIHVLRNSKRLFVGPVASLKHFKDDVRELNTGLEGGIVVEGFQDYAEGDILEAHRTEQME
jgi:translation initiation factor IF-2